VRIDKLSLAALEATLQLYRDPARTVTELPVSRMLSASEAELFERAERLLSAIAGRAPKAEAALERASGRAGGGALPLVELEGPVVAVRTGPIPVDDVQASLRRGTPPVIARVHAGALLLDPRTIPDREVDAVADAVAAALR
jgi:L-seryl-tRNA(Ser) seleniumtransferase